MLRVLHTVFRWFICFVVCFVFVLCLLELIWFGVCALCGFEVVVVFGCFVFLGLT